MRKLLNNPYVSGSLALFAIAFVARSQFNSNTNDLYSNDSEGSEMSVDAEAFDEYHDIPAQASSGFDSRSISAIAAEGPIRNIFGRPVQYVETEAQENDQIVESLRVKGIWIQNNIRYAVIGDYMLAVGDTVEGAHVTGIESNGVWLKSLGKSHFLKPGESWTYTRPQTASGNEI